MSETVKDEEDSPLRKRGRMTFLTKDNLRLQVGEYVDKRARAEQLLKESEKNLQAAIEKNQNLEFRLQKAEEKNEKLLKTIEILVQEIQNIRETHEKEMKEKNETFQEWIKTYTEECQAEIDAEKVKSEIEKAKWLGEIYRKFVNEKQKNIINPALETHAPTVTPAAGYTSTNKSSPETSIFPFTDAGSSPTSSSPAATFVVDHETAPPTIASDAAVISPNLQEQMNQRCFKIGNDFKKFPLEVQTKLKKDADRLVILLQEGKQIPQQNWLMSLLIANRLKPDSFHIQH
uniref:Uncharacterized protein n=1 Tax=Panagrolaimus sp. ES5 TaxID=591445 RepID=A0AC34F6M4_9BILA